MGTPSVDASQGFSTGVPAFKACILWGSAEGKRREEHGIPLLQLSLWLEATASMLNHPASGDPTTIHRHARVHPTPLKRRSPNNRPNALIPRADLATSRATRAGRLARSDVHVHPAVVLRRPRGAAGWVSSPPHPWPRMSSGAPRPRAPFGRVPIRRRRHPRGVMGRATGGSWQGEGAKVSLQIMSVLKRDSLMTPPAVEEA